MRRRELSPSFFTSKEVLACSMAARLCFQGLWLMADRKGKLVDDPWRIRLMLFPVDQVDIEGLLGELVAQGLIIRYEAESMACIVVPGFEKWQHPHPHEVASKLPDPPAVTSKVLPLQVTAASTDVITSRALPSKPSSILGPSSTSSDEYLPTVVTHHSADVEEIFAFWQEQREKPRAKLTAPRRDKIKARLKEGYTKEELLDAIRGVANDPWESRSQNGNDDLVYIMRSGKDVEKFAEFFRHPPALNGHAKPPPRTRREWEADERERVMREGVLASLELIGEQPRME